MAAMGGSDSFWMGSWQQCTLVAVLKGELIPLVSFFCIQKDVEWSSSVLGCIFMPVW